MKARRFVFYFVIIFSIFVLLTGCVSLKSKGNFKGYEYNKNLRYTTTMTNPELPLNSYESGHKGFKKVAVGETTIEELEEIGFKKKCLNLKGNNDTKLYFKPHAGFSNTDLSQLVRDNISDHENFYSYVCTWREIGYFQTPSLSKYAAKFDRSSFRTESYFIAFFAVKREKINGKEVETIIFKDFSGHPTQVVYTADKRRLGVLEVWLDKVANRSGDAVADELYDFLRENFDF